MEQVEAEIEKSGQRGCVKGLDLVVGRLSGVHVDAIRFAFELLSPGTIADGAELRIAEPHASVACRDCESRKPIDELPMRCPDCGSDNVAIEGGRDLLLQSIELEQ